MNISPLKYFQYLTILGTLIYSSWVLELLLNPKLSLSQSYVSELSVSGQPYAVYFRAANLFGSLSMFAGLILLHKYYKNTGTKRVILLFKILTILSFVGIVNAIFPMNCAPSQSHACFIEQEQFAFNFSQWVHIGTAFILFSGLLVAQFLVTFKILEKYSRSYWLNAVAVGGQLLLNSTVMIICLFGLQNVGVFQRTSLILFAAWLSLTVYFLPNMARSLTQQNTKGE